MCAQCTMASVVGAGTLAAGGRVWLAQHAPTWLTPRVARLVGALLVLGGVLAAGVLA